MRYQIVSHEELLKPRREAWENETCGEMVSNTTHSVHPEAGQRRESPKASTDCLLSLAAAPTFAIMALLTVIQGDGMPGMVCAGAQNASPLTGMVPDVLADGRLPFGALAEVDRQPERWRRPALIRRSPNHRSMPFTDQRPAIVSKNNQRRKSR